LYVLQVQIVGVEILTAGEGPVNDGFQYRTKKAKCVLYRTFASEAISVFDF
jgi:hypothetical protein